MCRTGLLKLFCSAAPLQQWSFYTTPLIHTTEPWLKTHRVKTLIIRVNVPFQISSAIFVYGQIKTHTVPTKENIMKEPRYGNSKANKMLTNNFVYKRCQAQLTKWMQFMIFSQIIHSYKTQDEEHSLHLSKTLVLWTWLLILKMLRHICCTTGQRFIKAISEMAVYSFLVLIQNSHKLCFENSSCPHVGMNATRSISASTLQQWWRNNA